MTLAPTLIIVSVGQQMNLTCTTSYCFPPATITWYLSSKDNINPTPTPIVTNETMGDLVRTNSLLQKSVDKSDNGQFVYCTASNIPGQIVNSSVQTVVAWCKLLQILLSLWNRNIKFLL